LQFPRWLHVAWLGLMFGGDNPIIGTKELFILGGSDLGFYKDTLTSTVPFWGNSSSSLFSVVLQQPLYPCSGRTYKIYILYSIFFHTDPLYLPCRRSLDMGRRLAGQPWFYGLCRRHRCSLCRRLGGSDRSYYTWTRHGKYDKDGKPKAIPAIAWLSQLSVFSSCGLDGSASTRLHHELPNPEDVVHIIVTTNTAAIAAILTATATSWSFIGKPDLGMTINGCLQDL